MHANRYIAREGKLYEIKRRDPEELREITTDSVTMLAGELNQAENWGREAVKRAFRQLLGVR
jgi:hypothetical protein